MYYYKATVQYDGTNYAGFQWQRDLRTIQNDINEAIKKLVTGKVSTMGASRTDTGVHAFEQSVKLTLENQIECSSFLEMFNEVLPPEIICLGLAPCESHFKPTTGTLSKEYRYYFTNIVGRQDPTQKFIANNPYPLDMEKIMACARQIVGTHSFHNFCSTGSNVKTRIRNVTFCEITKVDPHTIFSQTQLFKTPDHLESCYELRIVANGFLKQMIRHLMSALWLVGSGKLSEAEFLHLINGPKKEKRLWKVATPRGLYLYQIKYPLFTI